MLFFKMFKFFLYLEMVFRNGKGLFFRLVLIILILMSEWYFRIYVVVIKWFFVIESFLMDFGKWDSMYGFSVLMWLVVIFSFRRDVLFRYERWYCWRMLFFLLGYDIWLIFNILMFVWFNLFVIFGNMVNLRCLLLEMFRYLSFCKFVKVLLLIVFRMLDDKFI